jgi:hypothetical protein
MPWKRSAALTGNPQPFTDSVMNLPALPLYHRIEVKVMRSMYPVSRRSASSQPGHMILPLILILAGTVLAMSRFDIIHVARYWDLWPMLLIAAGLEELYLWATSGDD